MDDLSPGNSFLGRIHKPMIFLDPISSNDSIGKESTSAPRNLIPQEYSSSENLSNPWNNPQRFGRKVGLLFDSPDVIFALKRAIARPFFWVCERLRGFEPPTGKCPRAAYATAQNDSTHAWLSKNR